MSACNNCPSAVIGADSALPLANQALRKAEEARRVVDQHSIARRAVRQIAIEQRDTLHLVVEAIF